MVWVSQPLPASAGSSAQNQHQSLAGPASEAAALTRRGRRGSVQVRQASFPPSLPGHPLWVKDLFMHTPGAQCGTTPDPERGLNQVLRMQGTTWVMPV